MAAVVSHAMRRFPTSPSDTPYSSCRFEGEGASSGALSRSMRYADPWLYGGVASPAGAFLLTPAFALCGCADYAGGTKRSGKKSPTTCKKCKGTRLPVSPQLDSKFGTVRCYPTSVLPASATPTRADTVRVATRPSRPTVLPPPGVGPADDPYDLVRRSRLTGGTDHFLAISPLSPGRQTRSSGSKGDSPPSYNATVGRRSILECDINPYELVSPDLSDPHTPSITLVNGQRIRVRSALHQEHHEYEDVQLRLSSLPVKVNSKPAKVAPKRPNSTPSNATKEAPREDRVNDKKDDTASKGRTKIHSLQETSSDYFSNQFKSILKKSSIYDDVEPTELCQTRSPSPVKRRGSQFYIPMPSSPGSGAKKKVQFLVDDVTIGDKNVVNERPSECSSEDDEVFEKPLEAKEVPSEPESTEIIKKPPTLYRSLSDRIRKEEPKVNFNDTMALRYPKQRKNLKIDFSDLDRLDGAIHRARKVSPRPKVPPPPPPLPPPKHPEEEPLSPPVNKVEYVVDQAPEEKPDELVMMKKLDECINGDVTVPSETAPPSAPPRKRSNNKPPTVNVATPQPAVQRVQIESPDTNRTIVRISSPPAVHKLQIKNDYAETVVQAAAAIIENSQRKTSILINGDDCYSTVNVGDSVPLYQSSVVVKDSPPVQKKCSSVYITLPSPELVEPDPPELLMQLLKDPVEAVRRNLVPHVCGKADVSRRPRDKKTVKPLPDCKEDPPALCEDDLSSEHSSSTQYEFMDGGSESYSNRSSITEEELANRTKFYELLSESTAVEVTEGEDHLYECIKINNDPIYEEIEIPPPLPSNPPPTSVVDDLNLDKEFTTRSIFEGASKYDILSYLVDAKERGIVQEDPNFPNPFSYPFAEEGDSGEDNSLTIIDEKAICQKPAEIERNDSGVGSETSKSSLSKYRTSKQEQEEELCFSCCEDCDAPLEGETILCRKCCKKRSERKEIITEIVETEEKYGRDLQIILEEFYQPMLVAGLLTPEQLSTIFLNVEELLENSQALAEKLRDAVEIAIEQGDEDLLTVNTGKLFLEAIPMLHAFETYCVRQGSASLLLASLEKDKELLRIFLRVSQMENTMLRRMNLNSFLMVPVQRVTKYPLLLARLHKVTPGHLNNKEELQEAQHKIELHLNHMNSQTRDVPSKLWRRIGSSSGRRASAETDLVNIKLRKIAVDVLEWNHEEARFALEGKLLFTQPTDNNWRRGRTIKLTPVNALLVVNGKPVSNKSADRTEDSRLLFSRHGAREAALLLVRDKNGRYSLLRDPLYLDRCVIAADPAWQSYFEVQEILGRDTFIFKAEDEDQTNIWYKQLQFYAQGMGAWRKRRNALANIMINGMGLRS